MRVLLLGSDTPVGRSLQEFLLRRGRHVETLPLADCRWKSERRTKKALVRASCEFVVDTRLQAAADSGDKIFDLDLVRTQWLAKSCQKSKMAYLYLSTARVFSGIHERLYTEEDSPDNDEGIGKLLRRAEASVAEHCDHHLILRLGPVFSHRGVNVLTHMINQFSEGGNLMLEDHLRGCPVAADDAARVASGLLDQFSTGADSWGIYHYCSSDATDCYQFSEVLLACASQFSEFSPHAVELLRPEQEKEQLNRSLDCSLLRNTFAIKQNPWRGFVSEAVKRYFQSQK
ncbi:MAG: sugar nucleotide-binding protein [Halioglobus sp.]